MNTNLIIARKSVKKTQKEVSKKAGIAIRLYQAYEYGEKRPNIETAIKIADALQVKDLRKLW